MSAYVNERCKNAHNQIRKELHNALRLLEEVHTCSTTTLGKTLNWMMLLQICGGDRLSVGSGRLEVNAKLYQKDIVAFQC